MKFSKKINYFCIVINLAHIFHVVQWISRCASGERQRIILTAGRGSGLILRLTNQDFYRSTSIY